MVERVTILPPPPPLRVALWAAINACWFRLAEVVGRWARRAVQVARRLPALIGPEEEPGGSIAALARAGRLSSLAGRLARDRLAHTPFPRICFPGEDRPTVVEARR